MTLQRTHITTKAAFAVCGDVRPMGDDRPMQGNIQKSALVNSNEWFSGYLPESSVHQTHSSGDGYA